MAARGGTLSEMQSERRLWEGDEEVLVEMRPHPAMLVAPIVAAGGALALAIAIAFLFPSAPISVAWVLVAMVGLPALWCAGRVVRWRSERFVVTGHRIVQRRGVLRREILQVRLARVAEIECRQGMFDTLIGRGRLVLDVAGSDVPLVLDDVRRPRRVQRIVSGALDARDGVAAASTGARPSSAGSAPRAPRSADTPPSGTVRVARAVGGSVPEALLQLGELRRRGIISEAEFSAKKAELLDRL